MARNNQMNSLIAIRKAEVLEDKVDFTEYLVCNYLYRKIKNMLGTLN